MVYRTPATQDPLPGSGRFPWVGRVFMIFFLIAGVSIYWWYDLARSCDVRAVEKASTRLLRQRDRYDHSYQFATSAARDAIVRPVAELQLILMDTKQVAVPGCMQTTKKELIEYMRTVIHAFQAYGAHEADAAVREFLDQSDAHYDNFAQELESVNQCAPFCFP